MGSRPTGAISTVRYENPANISAANATTRRADPPPGASAARPGTPDLPAQDLARQDTSHAPMVQWSMIIIMSRRLARHQI
jgi:hypothetical protein